MHRIHDYTAHVRFDQSIESLGRYFSASMIFLHLFKKNVNRFVFTISTVIVHKGNVFGVNKLKNTISTEKKLLFSTDKNISKM